MKILFTFLMLLTTITATSQFKTKLFEDQNGSRKVAHCTPLSKSLGSGNATFVLTKNWYGMSLQLHIIDSWSDTYGLDYYKKLATTFVFIAGNEEEHIYKTSSNGAEKGDGGIYVYYDNEKILEYCKKYAKVKVLYSNSSFVFSLSGFTASYDEINNY